MCVCGVVLPVGVRSTLADRCQRLQTDSEVEDGLLNGISAEIQRCSEICVLVLLFVSGPIGDLEVCVVGDRRSRPAGCP